MTFVIAIRLLTVALAVALALPAAAADAFVTQSGLSFSPADLTISAGQEVEWDWTSGVHTVTSGAGPSDPNVGALFDAPLTSTNDSFSFHFNTAGDYYYFCRPHFGLDMVGVIRVTPSVPNEESTWSAVKSLYR